MVFIGRSAGFNFTTLTDNICIGDESGKYAVHTNSSSTTLQGNKNIFFGVRAGYHHVGYNNIAIGYHAGSGEASDWGCGTTNNYNISIGSYSLSNFTGINNTGWGWNNAIGGDSMRYIKNGVANVSFGYQALRGDSSATTVNASYNTSIGYKTLLYVTGGTDSSDNKAQFNVALGAYAGMDISESKYNTLLGSYAGRFIESDSQGNGGDYNICIGNKTGPASSSDRVHDSNRLYINAGDTYVEEQSLIYGDQSGTNQDLTFNADVVISRTATNSTGKLEVEGGAITLHGPLLETDTTNGKKWNLRVEDGGSSAHDQRDSNFSFTTHTSDIF